MDGSATFRAARLEVGERVLLPDGSASTVIGIDLRRELLFTDGGGSWYMEDLIPTPLPRVGDRASLEAWLDGPAYTVKPGLTTEVESVRCQCRCEQCYRMIVRNPDTGATISNTHRRDNDACRCRVDTSAGTCC